MLRFLQNYYLRGHAAVAIKPLRNASGPEETDLLPAGKAGGFRLGYRASPAGRNALPEVIFRETSPTAARGRGILFDLSSVTPIFYSPSKPDIWIS